MRAIGFLCLGLGTFGLGVGCTHHDCPTGEGGGPAALVCQGETYDVNGNHADGCEIHDATTDNHVANKAAKQGTYSACDMNGTAGFNITGQLPSDTRCHDPSIDGFDARTGSAPDFISIIGAGHTFCENDLVASLQIIGSNKPTCYHFAVNTGRNMYQCDVDATGTCGFNFDSGSQFYDGATITFEVSKTCGTDVVEAPTYRIVGHL